MRTKGPTLYKGNITKNHNPGSSWMKFFIALVIASTLIGGLITQDFFAQLVVPSEKHQAPVASAPVDQFNTHCLGTKPPEKYQLSGLIVTLGQSNFPVVNVVTTPKPTTPTTHTAVPKADSTDTPQSTPVKTDNASNQVEAKPQSNTTSSAIQQIANTTEPQTIKPKPETQPIANNAEKPWILQQPAKHFTLQIVSGRNQAALTELADKHLKQTPYAIYKRKLEGRDWYSLVVGSYPSPGAANRAKKQLPKGLNAHKAWPKKFAEIHKQLKQD